MLGQIPWTFCKRSRIAQKLIGLAQKHATAANSEVQEGGEYVSRHMSALTLVEPLFEALSSADVDGRIMFLRAAECVLILTGG
eukprot:m.219246 g.219246  ORF g.219246 m.219246 type:complete len:83 (+) comp10791_c3_seq18:3-251(+)